MAEYKEDADDVVVNEEELEKVLCVLAGSDPENCSYSRVRRAPGTASLQAAPRCAVPVLLEYFPVVY